MALLPRTFSPTGEYRNLEAVHLRTGSFRVLCHAEIESYLEDVALELYVEAWSLWTNHSYPSHTLTCLIGFSGVQTASPAESLAAPSGTAYTDIRIPLEKANNLWRSLHRNNNGIKEANVLRLFLPIGIRTAVLDQTLLNDLTSFGTSRGEIAHSSPTSTTHFLDPKSELDTVVALVSDLRSLDEVVDTELAHLRRASRRLGTAAAP